MGSVFLCMEPLRASLCIARVWVLAVSTSDAYVTPDTLAMALGVFSVAAFFAVSSLSCSCRGSRVIHRHSWVSVG